MSSSTPFKQQSEKSNTAEINNAFTANPLHRLTTSLLGAQADALPNIFLIDKVKPEFLLLAHIQLFHANNPSSSPREFNLHLHHT